MEDEGVKGREIHIAPLLNSFRSKSCTDGGGEQPLWSESRREKKEGMKERKESFEDANYENPLSPGPPPFYSRRRNSPRSRLQTAPSGAPRPEFLCGKGIFINLRATLARRRKLAGSFINIFMMISENM